MTTDTPHPDRDSLAAGTTAADGAVTVPAIVLDGTATAIDGSSSAPASADVVRLVHDLRQPLGVLIGYINLMLDHPAEFDEADRTAMLGEMRTAAERLDGMLHGMVASDDDMS